MLSLLVLGTLPAAHAEDYSFLTLRMADGSEKSFAVSGLTLTPSGSSLVAASGSDTQTYSLAALEKMYFSATATGVDGVGASEGAPVEVYSLSGMSVGTFESLNQAQSRLPKGVYIAKQGTRTTKMTLR